MNKNEPVSLSIVLRICEKLDCTIENVVSVKKLRSVSEKWIIANYQQFLID